MSTHAPSTWDTVHALAGDPSPIAALDREAICAAVVEAYLASPDGTVTSATIRPHIKRLVNPQRVGPVISALSRGGALDRLDRTDKSGNTAQRNGQRDMPVYLVTNLERVA